MGQNLVRAITRIQDADDLAAAPEAGDDGKALVWDQTSGKFVYLAAGHDISAIPDGSVPYVTGGEFAASGIANADGKIGIITPTPATTFEIRKDTDSVVFSKYPQVTASNLNGVGFCYSGFIIRNGSTAVSGIDGLLGGMLGYSRNNASHALRILTYGNYPIYMGTNGDYEQITVKSGNVGINKTSPANKLHVVDDDAAQIRIAHTTGGYVDLQAESDGDFLIRPQHGVTSVYGIIEQLAISTLGNNLVAASIIPSLPTPTDASWKGQVLVKVGDFSAPTGRDALQIEATGSGVEITLSGQVGVYNETAIPLVVSGYSSNSSTGIYKERFGSLQIGAYAPRHFEINYDNAVVGAGNLYFDMVDTIATGKIKYRYNINGVKTDIITITSTGSIVSTGALTLGGDLGTPGSVTAGDGIVSTKTDGPALLVSGFSPLGINTATPDRNGLVQIGSYSFRHGRLIYDDAHAGAGSLFIENFNDISGGAVKIQNVSNIYGRVVNAAFFGTGITQIGDPSLSNHVQISSTGQLRLVGTAKTYEDLYPSAVSYGFGVSEPDFSAYSGNMMAREFVGAAATVKELFAEFQMSHAREAGSDIVLHLHLYIPDNATGGDIKFSIEYHWDNIGDAGAISTTTISQTITRTAAAGIAKNQILSFPTITGTGKNISSLLSCRIYRDPTDVSDTFEASVWLRSFDAHVIIDSLGSDQISSKS